MTTRLALVTGGNRGLGKEIARQMAARGMKVIIGSRDLEDGNRVAAQLSDGGGLVAAIQLDVTQQASVDAAVAEIDSLYGRLDVLVNNAGLMSDQRAVELTTDAMRRIYEVNVFGTVAMTTAALPLLKKSEAARVVNVSSTTSSLSLTAGGKDFGGDNELRVAYASSKAALNMLTVHFAKAFAADPELRHIRINGATPGYIATDMTKHQGVRTVEQGARVLVKLAMDPDRTDNGGFFNEDGPLPY